MRLLLSARQAMEYIVFLGLAGFVRRLPVRAATALATGLAWVLITCVPKKLSRYHVAAANLRIAFGEDLPDERVQQIIRGMWTHLFRMVCEMVQLRGRFRLETCADILVFERRNECVQALLSDRPVLLLGGHFGNWEISLHTFGEFGFPMGVVARDLDNPWLHRWFQKYRESTGHRVISKSGAGVELAERLSAGGMVSLLCDQDAGRSGVFVDFFGRPASTFKSIALLALQFDALIIVGGAWRLPAAEQCDAKWVRFCVTTQEIIDPRDFQMANAVEVITQRYTAALEALIRRAPEQYFWVHRRWKTPPGPRRRKVIPDTPVANPETQA
ncbi:MAG: Lipid biosynthesis lauroyl acyltransferase [Planctomycetota bacterium]|jgi:KDO2-lipid IV(A) lauroyltransferase